MFRTLLTTTAMVALLQTGALAQDTTTPTPADPSATAQDPAAPATGMEAPADSAATEQPVSKEEAAEATGMEGYYTATSGQILANRLIGKAVYNGMGEDAESIGDINDLVLNSDGQAEAVIVGVGGFLGIGEKMVAVNFDRVEWTGEQGNERIVVEATREQLEAAPTFDKAAMASVDEEAQQNTAAVDTGMGTGGTAGMGTAGTGMATAPATPPADTGAAGTDQAATDTATEQESAGTEQAATDTATDDSAGTEQAATDTATEEESAGTDQAMNTDTATEEDTTGTDQAMSSDSEAPAENETAMTEEGTSDDMTTGAITADQQGDQPVDPEAMEQVDVSELTAEDLTGAWVYNADNESIGEVNDIILGEDKKIEAFVLDVGGFLGVGEKQVAVKAENIDFRRDENGDLRVFTPFTQEQLEQQAAYDEETYKNDQGAGALSADRT